MKLVSKIIQFEIKVMKAILKTIKRPFIRRKSRKVLAGFIKETIKTAPVISLDDLDEYDTSAT